MLQNAKIIKALDKDGMPKDLFRWSMDIEYFTEDIVKGKSAVWYYNEHSRVTITSSVTEIEEDENNLILSTENSVYYIKKYG